MLIGRWYFGVEGDARKTAYLRLRGLGYCWSDLRALRVNLAEWTHAPIEVCPRA